MSDYLVVLRSREDETPIALLRADRGVVESWQPQSREWIDAPFYVPQVYGEDRLLTRLIPEDQAEAMQETPDDLIQLDETDIAALNDSLAYA